MSDSEFMSSDDEIFDEAFDNDFIENIPNDSDSDGEDNGGSSNETLKLEHKQTKCDKIYHNNAPR
ncbi:uncharacterized protein OCT59_007195 [Rhizophagus irregularis]|uniref:uncharacterized protein n=1 Tax=Rhizophagus irregularis TaxID=588596 RepID=UPI00332E149B|nr:hypothetical protein OCT59_007195 [Rhizophagus irregularis]